MPSDQPSNHPTPAAPSPPPPPALPDRDIHIQSTANVGTTNDDTNVSGAKVTVGSAREVHVYSETSSRPSFLSAVLVNYVTNLPLPESIKP